MEASHAHSPVRERPPQAGRTAAVSLADAAWIAIVPCALLLVAVTATVGPWLGRTFMGPTGVELWPSIAWTATPEPEEHGRFVVALLGPPLLVVAMLVLVRRGLPNAGGARAIALARAGELALAAFVLLCVVAQHSLTYGAPYGAGDAPFKRVYFTVATLAAGAVLALGVVAVLHRRSLAERAARILRERTLTRVLATVAALLVTATWLLTALVFESSAENTTWAVVGNILWSMNETYAVLNGTGPLTDFHSQYAQLWPYVVALPMQLLGPSVDVYTATMVCIDLAALLAVFALLRRIVRSSLAALLLYLPFLATGFFMKLGPLDDRYGPGNLFSVWPVRYAGPYLLAWLTARHVAHAAPRHRVALLTVAGLVAINNPEFGIAAFAATAGALLWANPPRSWQPLARLAGQAVLGLLAACALVAGLTLAVVGQLPRFPQLFEFSGLYGVEGWAMAPMPTLGLHLVAYCTFGGAIVIATARAAGGGLGTVLTAMLGWSGVFGLIAGAYYAGRSHPEVLIDLFSAWAFAVVLLVVVVVQAIAARPSRRPRAIELIVLAGFGAMACSLAQTPTPWSQLDRFGRTGSERIVEQPYAVRFVAAGTSAGEKVAIVTPLSHRVAYDAGVTNVSPYSGIESMPTPLQFGRAIDALRESGGRKLYTWDERTQPETFDMLARAGFEQTRADDLRGYREWTDRGG